MKVTVIDYGLSNLLSVRRAFEHCGAEVEFTSSPEGVLTAKALVLPGVGAFADGMAGLHRLGLCDAIKTKAGEGTPFLGICLGMQMMFDESGENGTTAGLGLIPGRVELMPPTDTEGSPLRVPHVSWEPLVLNTQSTNPALGLIKEPAAMGEFYFVHSYEAKPADAGSTLASCVYGGHNVCAVAANARGNAVGCQFHPEKSAAAGLALISAFLQKVQ